MSLNDDDDIIKAVGFVAIYSAYLEDELGVLVEIAKKFINFEYKIEEYHLTQQAKILRKKLNRAYNITSAYFLKEEEKERVNAALAAVEKIAKERNRILHSPIIAKQGGVDVQVDRKMKTSNIITSKEI